MVDPKDLARFNEDWVMPLALGMYKMVKPNYGPGNKGSYASVKGMQQLNETYNIIKAIREGAEMAAEKRAFDNADVKIIDRTLIPPELREEFGSIINLGPKKLDYGEVTDDQIRGNRRNIGYSAYDDSYSIPYLEGDTLGDVINELGIGTQNGLWGANGDVAYYTNQLMEQGALDKNGNIKPGTVIKLTRRK